MNQKSEVEMQTWKNIEFQKTMIRFRHRMALADEMNEVIPVLKARLAHDLSVGGVKKLKATFKDIVNEADY